MLGQVASGRLLIFRANRAWAARWVDEFTTGTSDPGGGTGGGVGGAAAVETSLESLEGSGSLGGAGGPGGASGTDADAGADGAAEGGSAGAGMTSLGVMSGRAEAGLPALALLKSVGVPKFPKRLWAHGSFITVCNNDSASTTSATVSSETPA